MNGYPLLFKPVYKDYLWGGDRIIRHFKRQAAPGLYAESWEVSDRPDGMSRVQNGPLAGRTLADLLRQFPGDILGPDFKKPAFPLLIKLIDSRERLSVQVHPDDESAGRFGGEAKTEMWYVLGAGPGAGIFAGFKPGVDEATLDTALREKTIKDILNFVPIRPGDAVFIPGGRVHAIGAGCLLYELQQNSNTTYRLYDWDRTGPDGKPRPLHIQQARKVINWKDSAPVKVAAVQIPDEPGVERWRVLESPYFRMERLVLSGSWRNRGRVKGFEVLFVVSGRVTIGGETLTAGASALIPASLREYSLDPGANSAEVLKVTGP